MDQHRILIIIATVVIVLVLVALAWLVTRKRRSQQLRQRFGPEYDRVVGKEGDVRRGEGVLEWRAKRIEKINIVTLSAPVRAEFANRWTDVQSRFVDDPNGAVSGADSLVNEVMQARGYPVGNFEQRAGDISVDHPIVVENYRVAHDIALRHGRGEATTEDLRKAMVHYRSLFHELLEDKPERKEA